MEAPGKPSNGVLKAADAASQAAPTSVQDSSSSNSSSSTSKVDVERVSEPELVYRPPGIGEKFWTNFKLTFALPWRRFKQDSVLVLKVSAGLAGRLCSARTYWLERTHCRYWLPGVLDA